MICHRVSLPWHSWSTNFYQKGQQQIQRAIIAFESVHWHLKLKFYINFYLRDHTMILSYLASRSWKATTAWCHLSASGHVSGALPEDRDYNLSANTMRCQAMLVRHAVKLRPWDPDIWHVRAKVWTNVLLKDMSRTCPEQMTPSTTVSTPCSPFCCLANALMTTAQIMKDCMF